MLHDASIRHHTDAPHYGHLFPHAGRKRIGSTGLPTHMHTTKRASIEAQGRLDWPERFKPNCKGNQSVTPHWIECMIANPVVTGMSSRSLSSKEKQGRAVQSMPTTDPSVVLAGKALVDSSRRASTPVTAVTALRAPAELADRCCHIPRQVLCVDCPSAIPHQERVTGHASKA